LTLLDQRDLAAIEALMRDVATRHIMPGFGRTKPGQIHIKSGPLDPVTDADRAAEAALIDGLGQLFPGIGTFGEEGAEADPSGFAALDRDAPIFVIDPIDGTQNYAAGLPLFGTMIALIAQNQVLAGLIYDPIRNDTVIAQAGGGAWLWRGAERTRLRMASAVPLTTMIAAISWQYMPEPERSRVLRGLVALGQLPNFRCAAQTYRAMAMGAIHASLSRRTLPWDHAAGSLIVAEAGGFVRQPDGAPWHPNALNGGIMVAPDQASWQALHAALYSVT
jgi:fructose-1,6-bisphosphatase/inositol monophosphatase family enzyme